MADEYDGRGRLLKAGATTSEDEHQKTLGTERKTFTAAAVGAKAGGSDMPKQRPEEDAAAYGSRLRQWRERKSAAIK